MIVISCRMWLTAFLMLLFENIQCIAFNTDENNIITFKSGNNENLFGHSIVVSNDQVIIGAPESDMHGNLFKCLYDRDTFLRAEQSIEKDCTKINSMCIS